MNLGGHRSTHSTASRVEASGDWPRAVSVPKSCGICSKVSLSGKTGIQIQVLTGRLGDPPMETPCPSSNLWITGDNIV